MKVVAIVQARMSSSRLPGKVLKDISGIRLIDLLLKRLSMSALVDEIVVATTSSPADDPFVSHLKERKVRVVRGDENDVLSRFKMAADKCAADIIVRITGDCPFVMPEQVDKFVSEFTSKDHIDYLSNLAPPTFPDGLDIEVFSKFALDKAAEDATSSYDREHVTPYIRDSGNFQIVNLSTSPDYSGFRVTVDEPDDLATITNVLKEFGFNHLFNYDDLINLMSNSPDIFAANASIQRNEGASISNGQKLWKRAIRVIPGGNMLLSKHPELLLPGQWPTYFDRAKGCTTWDLEGNEYIDVGYMGIGTNSLGYGHPEVDEAVLKAITKGNMSTLNCPEEVLLAEKLIDINPWADSAKFARSGGEANSIAIRIARAASGKDNVAVCGYHGWHDWYLSANLEEQSNLDTHLLPGLNPNGVPKNLSGSTHPFLYNDVARLESLIETKNIGVIKMEVFRNTEPKNDFLHTVRQLATQHGIVLIFDECTSGFRECFGGLHNKYKVEPDIAVYGKTLGNGYAITAVVGRQSVMEAASTTFISSTFWTDRIGPTAALKTLEVMERERSWEIITDKGMQFRERLKRIASISGVKIDISGLPSLTTYSVNEDKNRLYKTLITQEMLKRGFLAPPAFYACLAHEDGILEKAYIALEETFEIVSNCINEKISLKEQLRGPVCTAGLPRLN